MNRPLDIDFYIGFFSAIPEKRWTVDTIDDCMGKHCALGLCMQADVLPPSGVGVQSSSLAMVNDFGITTWDGKRHYQQTSPKQRVLAYLKDVKAGRAK